MKLLFTMVGMKHRGTEAIVSAMKPGDRLLLIREPDNPHDPNAIAVHAGGLHVAYVKGVQARDLARVMDYEGAASLDAAFTVTADRWPQVELERP